GQHADTEADPQPANAAVAEDEHAETRMAASEALVEWDGQSGGGVSGVLLKPGVADQRVGRISRVIEFPPEEAAGGVLIIAVVDAPVLVLALEGVGADVLFADQRRVTEPIGDAGESGPAAKAQDLGTGAAVVEGPCPAHLLAVDDSRWDRDSHGAVIIGGSR